MRSFVITVAALALSVAGIFSLSCQRKEPEKASKPQVIEAYGKVPLTFVENKGQVDEEVRFLVRGPRGTVFFTDDAVVFDVVEKTAGGEEDTLVRRKGVVVRANFEGANPSPHIEGLRELPGKVNVFRGKDPSKWRTGISTFEEIVYRELWPGVDLTYTGEGNRLRYEMVIKPKGNVEDICFRYEGVEEVRVNEKGDLLLETSLGTIVEGRPLLHQIKDGKQVEMSGGYRVSSDKTVRFEVGRYDRKLPLLINQS